MKGIKKTLKSTSSACRWFYFIHFREENRETGDDASGTFVSTLLLKNRSLLGKLVLMSRDLQVPKLRWKLLIHYRRWWQLEETSSRLHSSQEVPVKMMVLQGDFPFRFFAPSTVNIKRFLFSSSQTSTWLMLLFQKGNEMLRRQRMILKTTRKKLEFVLQRNERFVLRG